LKNGRPYARADNWNGRYAKRRKIIGRKEETSKKGKKEK